MEVTTSAPAPAEHGTDRLPWRTIVGWGLGSTTLGAANFAKVLVLGFLVDYVGVAAAIAAMIVAMSNIYDAAFDPLVGSLSDRTHSRWGRRIPYLFFGALLLCFAWILLFNVPADWGKQATIVYVALSLIVFSTGYGMFGVPYNAMPAEMTDDYHARTLLMSARSVFSTLGVSAGGFVAPLLISHFGGGRHGHAMMAWYLGGLVLAISLVGLALLGRPHTIERAPPPRVSRSYQVRSMLRNRPFLVLLFSHLSGTVGVMMMNGAAVFYVRRVLGASDAWLGMFFLYLNVLMFASLPACVWLGRRIGKRDTFIVGSLISSAASFSWYWAALHESYVIFFARVLAVSFGAAAMIVMGFAMLPDTQEYDRRRTGLHREGIYSGFFTTAEKGSSALGVALVGVILSGYGYVQSGGDTLRQSASALFGVYVAFGIGPGVFILFGAVLMLFYRLDEKTLKATVSDVIAEGETLTMPPLVTVMEAH